MLELKWFGKGSAFSHDINSSAYIHDKGSSSILIIDCGENTFKTISGFIEENDIKNVDIAITHMHSDHVGGLSTLIYWLHFIKSVKPTIQCHIDILNNVKTLLDLYNHKEDQYNLYGQMERSASIVINIQDFFITPVRTIHIDGYNSFGFELLLGQRDGEYKRVYYSGDSKILPDYVKEYIEHYDAFYQDLVHYYCDFDGHMSVEEFIEEYPKEVWSKVTPYHLSDIESLKRKCIELDVNIKF